MGFGGFFCFKNSAPNSTTTKALAPNLNTTNQLNTQAKDIDIQAGSNGSLMF
jgi:hypothetical protein